MLNNDSAPATTSPEISNNTESTSSLETVVAKGQVKSLPCLRSNPDANPEMLENALTFPLWDILQSDKDDYGLNSTEINSGLALQRVYNIENVEVVKPNFITKGKKDKSKELNKKHDSSDKEPNREQSKRTLKHDSSDKVPNREQSKRTLKHDSSEKVPNREQSKRTLKHDSSDKVPNREQSKRALKTKEPITTDKPQIKNKEHTPQKKFEVKLNKKSTDEKGLKGRRAVSQPILIQRKPKAQRQSQPQPSPSERKKSLESRITTKIWQILNRDVFLLDHEKFNSQIQATNSETKHYIINVIKKYNNKQLKRQNPPKVTQTSKKNSLANIYRDKKRALKIAVRRRVFALAKTTVKHSKHWSQFLTDNHIIIDNIDIDKLDLSFVDLEALEIENKMLKRTLMWLFT